MTGPEHYKEAERLRDCARDAMNQNTLEMAAYFNAAAQVHATLALTAAIAYPAIREYLGDESSEPRDWTKAVSP